MKKKCQWISVAVTFGLLAAGSAEAASDSATVDTAISASTSAPLAVPPSSPIQPFGIYTGYQYLSNSTQTLQLSGAGTLALTATTYAKIPVSTIGAKLQLQQWAGGTWVPFGPEIDCKENNLISYRAATTYYVSKGVIYRARITHYINHKGLNEQAVEYTDTIYIT